ncbi:hypothetical protein J437_LFUL016806 [Ladona fulva]|uniref:Uncharacterized protein n=1 Tax=Ladona fulva TaxID=123851 RepID=A0A8K0NX93_LADFU|nr:hypothetical protein J437_LFUL016806 [Ladona fulva]
MLERSVEKDPFPPHMAYLADTYREIAKANHRSSQPTRELEYQSQILLENAVKMYEDCVEDTNASTVVLTRCGFGLIKLPKKYRNVKLAKEAFERAMKSGSRRATIGMGHLLDWCMDDYKEALKYFEEAYSAESIITGLEIIKMKFKIDDDYNPLEDCDKFIKDLEGMMEERHKHELIVAYCMLKAEYLLVKREDLLAAVRECRIAMDQQCDSKYLWVSIHLH